LFREFVAEKRRTDAAARETLAHAWHTARFVMNAMNGKLPSLSSVLSKAERGDIRSQLELVARHAGIKPVPPTPATIKAFRIVKEPRG